LTLRLDPAAAPPPEPGLDDDQSATHAQPPSSATTRRPPRARRCPSCQQAFSGEARFCPFDGDALAEAPDWNPSADPLIGQTVDSRYEVVSVIGEGGMGTVYEVRHVTLGRRFALKVLRRDLADAEHTARFIQEAKAAAAIGHPNIVAVSDFGEIVVGPAGSAAVPYFVMEYLTGISLASLLRAEKTLDPARAAEILLQCASGLAAAHAAGVIHRDLKPDNIFLTRTGDREFVKLLDFGVAKMAGAGRLTRAGMVFGTPHYMSPEQAAGQSVDHRADIYALGVILYECFAGRVPFEADTYMGVLTKHMFATPEPIERVVPDPAKLGALAPIAMRCLAKNPHDRYPSMAEVVAAIEGAVGDAVTGRRGRSERPGRGRPADGSDAPDTPGLRPVVGPVGIGLGAVALALVALLAVRELRGRQVDAAQVPSAEPSATPTATAATTAPPTPPILMGTSTVAPPTPTATAVHAPRPDPPTPTSPSTATAVTPASTATDGRTRPTRLPSGPVKKGKGDVVDPWGK
jgi:serine/threonine-protein kinase